MGLLLACDAPPDSWSRRDFPGWARAASLAPERIVRVSPGQQPGAQARLERDGFVSVTASEAAALCGCGLSQQAPAGWWLVRSVTYRPSSDMIQVRAHGGDLLVSRSALGRRMGRMTREAVLVAPDVVPSAVWTEASLAE